MSLTRSLFALASLLSLAWLFAVADATYNCITELIGKKTDYAIDMPTINVKYPEVSYQIDPKDDICQPQHHAGEKIMVCNRTPDKPEAEVVFPYRPALSPVRIKCNDDTNGCTAALTEYCK